VVVGLVMAHLLTLLWKNVVGLIQLRSSSKGKCGGPNSAKILFEGKIVEMSNRLIKGHSIGQLIVEGYSPSFEAGDVSSPGFAVQPNAKIRQHLRINFEIVGRAD